MASLGFTSGSERRCFDGLFDHFIRFFIRELLNELSDGMDKPLRLVFLVARLCDSSLYVIALSKPLSFDFVMYFALVTVCSLIVLSFVRCAVFSVTAMFDCSTVELRPVTSSVVCGTGKSVSSSRCRCSCCVLLQLGRLVHGRLLEHLVVRCLVWS